MATTSSGPRRAVSLASAQHRGPAAQSRFIEGSMNDRVSVAPPATFLGADELQRSLEEEERREVYDRPSCDVGSSYPRDSIDGGSSAASCSLAPSSRPTSYAATQRSSWTTVTSAASEDAAGQPAKRGSAGFLAPLWDGVRERLHLSRAKSTTSFNSDKENQPPKLAEAAGAAQQQPHLQDQTPQAVLQQFQQRQRQGPGPGAGATGGPSARPPREEIMQNYQSLVDSGFFDAHAVKSSRQPPPPGMRAGPRPQKSLPQLPENPASPHRGPRPPISASRFGLVNNRICSQPSYPRRPSTAVGTATIEPFRDYGMEIQQSQQRGTKRDRGDDETENTAVTGDSGTVTSAHKLVKKLRKSASRISADMSGATKSQVLAASNEAIAVRLPIPNAQSSTISTTADPVPPMPSMPPPPVPTERRETRSLMTAVAATASSPPAPPMPSMPPPPVPVLRTTRSSTSLVRAAPPPMPAMPPPPVPVEKSPHHGRSPMRTLGSGYNLRDRRPVSAGGDGDSGLSKNKLVKKHSYRDLRSGATAAARRRRRSSSHSPQRGIVGAAGRRPSSRSRSRSPSRRSRPTTSPQTAPAEAPQVVPPPAVLAASTTTRPTAAVPAVAVTTTANPRGLLAPPQAPPSSRASSPGPSPRASMETVPSFHYPRRMRPAQVMHQDDAVVSYEKGGKAGQIQSEIAPPVPQVPSGFSEFIISEPVEIGAKQNRVGEAAATAAKTESKKGTGSGSAAKTSADTKKSREGHGWRLFRSRS